MTAKKAAAPASTAGPFGCPSSPSTAAAAASDSAYCATLKTSTAGRVRKTASPIAEASAYTTMAAQSPKASRTATPNALETVSQSLPARRGTWIGSSSPATTSPARTHRAGSCGSANPAAFAAATATNDAAATTGRT